MQIARRPLGQLRLGLLEQRTAFDETATVSVDDRSLLSQPWTPLDIVAQRPISAPSRRNALDKELMLQVNTYVAASPIEGVGVFTAEPIAKGQIVWSFDPLFDRLISMADYERAKPQVRDFLDKYAYPSPDQPGFVVYESDNGRFMNHTSTPNLDFSDHGGARALRDIAAGEELTCNYADFFPEFELMPGGEEIVAGLAQD